jgi:hypothetical protein
MRGTILRTGSETNGELFEVEFLVEPGDWTGPDHIHLRQEERLEVTSGQLRLRAAGKDEPLTPGSPRVLAPGTSHNLRNEGPGGRACSCNCVPLCEWRATCGLCGERRTRARSGAGARPASWSSRSSSANTQTSSSTSRARRSVLRRPSWARSPFWEEPGDTAPAEIGVTRDEPPPWPLDEAGYHAANVDAPTRRTNRESPVSRAFSVAGL